MSAPALAKYIAWTLEKQDRCAVYDVEPDRVWPHNGIRRQKVRVRVLALLACCVMSLAACQRVAESKLVGGWNATSPDGEGEFHFETNHKFAAIEWSFADPHQLPHAFQGEWHVRANKLLLDLGPGVHIPERTELAIDILDENHVALRHQGNSHGNRCWPCMRADVTLERRN